MPLDPDTQYYALDPADAGAQPAAAPDPNTAADPGTDPDLSGPLMAAPPNVPALPAILALAQQLSGVTTGNGKDASKSAPLVPMASKAADSSKSPALQALAQMVAASPSASSTPADDSPASNNAASRSALAALQQQLTGITPSLDPYQTAPPPAIPGMTAMLDPTQQAGGSGSASAPPASGPAPLTMPQMPKHNNTALQIIGTLAALSGGSGGKVLGAYVDARNAHDVQTYNQQVQAYQQQQHDNQQQASANGLFLNRLGKQDVATQESTVRNLTPAMMQAYGYTAAQVQSQFFDAAGNFKPVGTDDSKQQGPVLRAQTAFRSQLLQETPTSQQAIHDSFASHPDDWKMQTGTDYDNWKPSTTTKAVQGEEKIVQSGQKVQQGQEKIDQGTTKLEQGDRKLDQGDTQLNLNAQSVKNREGDAQRTAQVRQLSQQQQAHYQDKMTQLKAEGLNIQQAHNVAMEQIGRENAATSRLRANAAQSGGSTGGGGIRALRAQLGGAPTAASYQSAINTANTTKNHILANAHDKDGNQIPLTSFQQSVVDSANNSILQAQHGQRALAHGVNPITGQQITPSGGYVLDQRTGRPAVAPDGSLVRPLPPMPVSVPAGLRVAPKGAAMNMMRAQLGTVPLRTAPGRSMAPSSAPAAAAPLTPQQRAGMSNQDFARYFAQRLATKLGGR